MRLAARRGSFLFVHAGLDDRTATMLRDHGTSHVNQLFQSQLFGSPFEFYFGPVANAVRTKYRQVDMPLSAMGQHQAERAGIHAIVHGHRNLHRGQRLTMRQGILHFECDITMDRASRAKEGLTASAPAPPLSTPMATSSVSAATTHKSKSFSLLKTRD